ncbi:MAG: hypothetical protein JXA67_08440 [Micromonosporaceae bacterium]|nr:hypothetical protein [Micromonosporaceae bacterium]
MANSKGHRRFGNVRKLPSGSYQARYVGPDSVERKAPNTFETERQAQRWLTVIESEIIRGERAAPEAGQVKLDDYARTWIEQRKLAPVPGNSMRISTGSTSSRTWRLCCWTRSSRRPFGPGGGMAWTMGGRNPRWSSPTGSCGRS